MNSNYNSNKNKISCDFKKNLVEILLEKVRNSPINLKIFLIVVNFQFIYS